MKRLRPPITRRSTVASGSPRSGSAALTLATIALVVSGCSSSPDTAQSQAPGPSAAPGLTYQTSLPVSDPPFDTLHASWVVRLEEGYVYMDHYGSYTDTAAHLPTLIREMRVQGIEPSGPPFCLFYDDPAATPRDQLRSRACVPIEGIRSPKTPLAYDVLPAVSVAYAYVSGPYPEVPRAYPRLFQWMAERNWIANGPIREEYIVPPSRASKPSDYLCQIQIPVTMAPR